MVILITGASSGIGQSCAKFLKNKGYRVYGSSRKVEMGKERDGIIFVRMDVGLQESVDQAIDFIIKKESKIDVLVNNAGVGMMGSAEDVSIDEMQAHFNTNYYGVLRVMQAVLPSMRNQGGGKIINISSLASFFGLPYRGVYCAAKAGVNLVTESARMEVEKHNIHLSVLAPGDFNTGIKNARMTAEKTQHSIYKDEYNKVLEIVDHEVAKSGDPIKIAKIIYKIINSRKPKAYYIAASPFQKLVVHLRYWLPTSLFQKLMKRNYGMN